MAIFEMQGPDGKTFEIDAPHEQAAIDAFKRTIAQPSLGDIGEDVAKSGGIGIAKGGLQMIGAGGDVRNLASAATDYLVGKAGGSKETASTIKNVASKVAGATPLAALNVAPTTADLQGQVEKVTGKFYEPKTEYGKTAELAGELVPGAVTAAASGGGTLAGNLVRYAAIPAVATRVAENNIPESSWKPYAVTAAGIGSSLINPARAITPIESSVARQAAVRNLENEGVTSLTAGQRTGNKSLQYLESAASHAPGAGGGVARMEHEGQRQFTEAAVRRAGAGPDAAPEVLAANQRRLGQAYEDISARNTINMDQHTVRDIINTVDRYQFVPGSQQNQMVQRYIDDIMPHIQNGTMPGREYQALRSFLTEDMSSASDGYLKNALRGLRGSLDRSMERSLPADEYTAWRNLNREYSAQKVLEKAASRAGEATAEGQITPANLRNTIAAEDRPGYARGQGQFNELARSGVQVMTPLPNSGTAQRANAFHVLNAFMFGAPQAVAGRAVTSAPVQQYLSNQLLNGALPNSPEARRLLALELLRNSQQSPAPVQ